MGKKFSSQISETLPTVADAPSRQQALLRSDTETVVGSVDNVARSFIGTRSPLETLQLPSDIPARLFIGSRVLVETSTLAGDVGSTDFIGGRGLSEAVLHASDTIDRLITYEMDIAEVIPALVDNPDRLFTGSRQEVESLSQASDAVSRTTAETRETDEAVPAPSDILLSVLSLLRSVVETLPSTYSSVTDSGHCPPRIDPVVFTSPSVAQGLTSGGTAFSFVSNNIDVASLQDSFTSPPLSGIWTSATSGTGSVVVLPAPAGSKQGTLALNTGTTVSSTARIRSVDTSQYQDIEVTAAFNSVYGNPNSQHLRATLGLYSSSTSLFRLVVETDAYGLYQVKLLSIDGGVTTLNNLILSTGLTPIGAPFSLRLLRSQGRVDCYFGGGKIYQTVWASSPNASVEIGMENSSGATSSGVLSVTHYLRRPVMIFGTEPMSYMTFTGLGRIDGVTPAVTNNVGAVSVIVASSSGVQTFSNAWTFMSDPTLLAVGGAIGQSRLVVTNDSRIKALIPEVTG